MFDRIHLTGFKPFGQVKVNPTELIIDYFQAHPIPKVHTTRLQVSTNQVDHYIDSLSKQLATSQQCTLNLHLGVGCNSVYHLEVCAYNNKTFRIPDNAGKQYNAEKINQKDELDHMLKCHLDLNDLMTKLKNHDIVLSTDPGRYLCNYVYFRSLDTLCSANKNAQSLFVHIPPTQHKSHEQNVSFVEALLHLLLKQ